MPMRIKIPNRAAQYVIDLANQGENGATPLQQKLASLSGHDKILVTDDEDMVDELRNAMADLVSDSINRRKEGDPSASQDASAAAKTITHIDQAEERRSSPKANAAAKYDHYELYDHGNELDTAQYQTFAAAIQVARGKKWRNAKWEITGDDGTSLRKHDEQQEIDYRASLPEPKAKPAKKAAAKVDADTTAEAVDAEAGPESESPSTNGNGRRGRGPAKKAPAKKASRPRAKASASA